MRLRGDQPSRSASVSIVDESEVSEELAQAVEPAAEIVRSTLPTLQAAAQTGPASQLRWTALQAQGSPSRSGCLSAGCRRSSPSRPLLSAGLQAQLAEPFRLLSAGLQAQLAEPFEAPAALQAQAATRSALGII